MANINDPRYMNKLMNPNDVVDPNAQPQMTNTQTVPQLVAPVMARQNDPTIPSGPAVGSVYQPRIDPNAQPNIIDRFSNSGIGQVVSDIGSGAKRALFDIPTDNIANTINRGRDLVFGHNAYDGVGYAAPSRQQIQVPTGALSKAANYSNPPPLTAPDPYQVPALNLPQYNYKQFQPNAVDVGNVANQARDFGGTINLDRFNKQLNGNLESNGMRENDFNGQINDIMAQLEQSKLDLKNSIGGISSSGTFSGILQSKLLAKEAGARRTQLQAALAAILQQRIGSNDSNRNNLQTLGLNATNAQATNAADFSQSLGKNILNNAVQKDINNNAQQNNVADLVSREQFSSDAKQRQFDLATKERQESQRRQLASLDPRDPRYAEIMRSMNVMDGGSGNPKTEFQSLNSTDDKGNPVQNFYALSTGYDGTPKVVQLTNQARMAQLDASIDKATKIATTSNDPLQVEQARAALKSLLEQKK